MAVNSGTSASRAVLEGAGKLVRVLTESAAALTERGRRIDNYQVLTRRLAGLATRYRAAEFLTGYAQRCQDLNDVANAFETPWDWKRWRRWTRGRVSFG